jgi:hypothetical protein
MAWRSGSRATVPPARVELAISWETDTSRRCRTRAAEAVLAPAWQLLSVRGRRVVDLAAGARRRRIPRPHVAGTREGALLPPCLPARSAGRARRKAHAVPHLRRRAAPRRGSRRMASCGGARTSDSISSMLHPCTVHHGGPAWK